MNQKLKKFLCKRFSEPDNKKVTIGSFTTILSFYICVLLLGIVIGAIILYCLYNSYNVIIAILYKCDACINQNNQTDILAGVIGVSIEFFISAILIIEAWKRIAKIEITHCDLEPKQKENSQENIGDECD